MTNDPSLPELGIAVIGMAGRFPGAKSIEEYWKNLCDGIESVGFFRDDELDPTIDPLLRQDPSYVKARGILDDIELFDASFFGISPREAELMDPQQRIFLELAWSALETAGYVPEKYGKPIGIYAGMNWNTYYLSRVARRPDIVDRFGEFATMLLNEKDFLTTRVSYKLNLKGPSLNIFTACSTSLVAIASAFEGLLTFQCDMALAGGISIVVPQKSGYLYQEGAMLSPDGHCRPFDAKGQGTTFGCGAGIAVLKRIEDALQDGDEIYAVIRGVGINNDGSGKVSFTAPSVEGQAEVVAMALGQAAIPPETVTYIETHGTGTPLGDPCEVEALRQAFVSVSKRHHCALGSVKSNFGHLVHAAGIAGFIKAVLAIRHGVIPPTLFFEEPNPKIPFAETPFYVNSALQPWKPEGMVRRAGVSSFGVGGTNAHVIVEEAPSPEPSGDSRPVQLIMLSARSAAALDAATERLRDHARPVDDRGRLADIAFTLCNGRKDFSHRRIAVCGSGGELAALLEKHDPGRVASGHTDRRDRPVAFMFPGQGSQYLRMGSGLYAVEPTFRQTVDQCAEVLLPVMGIDLRDVLKGKDQPVESAERRLAQTMYLQPALFTIEYALARLWMSWGIRPDAMIGHSIGEFVAACVAGVFGLEDALTLVAARGKMMQEVPPGTMLSVRAPADTVLGMLSAGTALAAINGPSLCVASGPHGEIASLQKTLEAKGILCKPLHTSHAFHSPMMDAIVKPFGALVGRIRLSPPSIPVVSTATAAWMSASEATDPDYWARHLRATVRFADGVRELWREPDRLLLEVGPRTVATVLARQQAQDPKQRIAIPSLGDSADNDGEHYALCKAIGQLWIAGKSIDFAAYYSGERRRRISLPTYPFERKRFWIDPPSMPAAPTSIVAPSAILPQFAQVPTATEPVPFLPQSTAGVIMAAPSATGPSRKERLIPLIKEVLESTTGEEVPSDPGMTFLEMGFDSLSLTQASLSLKQKFNVAIAFRQLIEDITTVESLAEYLDKQLPPDALPQPAATSAVPATTAAVAAAGPMANTANTNAMPAATGDLRSVIDQQLRIMAWQLQMLGLPAASMPALPSLTTAQPSAAPILPPQPAAPISVASAPPKAEAADVEKAFVGPQLKIGKSLSQDLSEPQKKHLSDLVVRYNGKTKKSKEFTQKNRSIFADPRAASGFKPLVKELVYPIVVERSSGCRLWDIDGNEYIDMLNGFGSNYFGYSAPFVTKAVKHQIDRGMEIGPTNALVGEVARLVCEFTKMERVAFCNTGSEAVLGAMRLARTVTGRSTIAIFTGAYHGIFDEVIIKGTKKLRTLPASPGIMAAAVQNMLVLDYGEPASLEIIRERSADLAAVLVEPVQSRLPELQPREFLQQLREITESRGVALIFDEVVTGFRVGPGGAQEYFGIAADIATYGKVVGGGMPIGVIAGKRRFMDAFDGGFWQFGDESVPEVGVTYFAGTFVRHPPALAAAKAVLEHLKKEGPQLQQKVNERTAQFVSNVNVRMERARVPIRLTHFSSIVRVGYTEEVNLGELLFVHLRNKGVHIWDHRPVFLTTVHTDADLASVADAFSESVEEMQRGRILPAGSGDAPAIETNPPRADARLGRDAEGNPAWFVPDPDRQGKYLQIGRNA